MFKASTTLAGWITEINYFKTQISLNLSIKVARDQDTWWFFRIRQRPTKEKGLRHERTTQNEWTDIQHTTQFLAWFRLLMSWCGPHPSWKKNSGSCWLSLDSGYPRPVKVAWPHSWTITWLTVVVMVSRPQRRPCRLWEP